MNLGTYDESAPPMEDFTPLPPGAGTGPEGMYLVAVETSKVDPTKNRDGERLNLKWRVLEGEHANRIVFHGINIRHVNPKAQEIGQRELASLRQATGVLSARDSSEFHGIPCWMKLAIRPAGPDKQGVHREAQNEVKAIKRVESAPAGQGAPPQQSPRQNAAPAAWTGQQQPAAAGASGKPPWSRPK